MWPEARKAYAAGADARRRMIEIEGCPFPRTGEAGNVFCRWWWRRGWKVALLEQYKASLSRTTEQEATG